MIVFKNESRLSELAELHFKAYTALISSIAAAKHGDGRTLTKARREYEAAEKRIVDIHEQADREHKDWLDQEFGEEVREERYSKRSRVAEPDEY